MKTYCKKLLSIGGTPILDSSSINYEQFKSAQKIYNELQNLLSLKNGFYCFESALHIFPSGTSNKIMTLEKWNSPKLWRENYGALAEGFLFFAEDIFGGQFGILEDAILSFDPETGDTEKIADNLEDWAKCILNDYDYFTGYSIAHSWQNNYGLMPDNKRLLPKIPFVGGGEFDINNLYLLDSAKGMNLRANLAQKLTKSLDGTKIKLSFTE